MLQSLYITNYALISNLDIPFEKGLTSITGETGAGKSILLGALSLLMGQRADLSILKDKEQKCIVEAQFLISGNVIPPEIFDTIDVDVDKHIVIRREITPNGKSRAFINDTPVGLPELKIFSGYLIDIHSQHQNLELNNNIYQLEITDIIAKNQDIVNEYSANFKLYQQYKKQYADACESALKEKGDIDYIRFQYDELHKANLIADEQESLEDELKKLEHAEEIKSALLNIEQLLNNEDNSMIVALKEVASTLLKTQKYLGSVAGMYERVESCYLEIKDIVQEVSLQNAQIDLDPKRLQTVKERLDLLNHLLLKHKCTTVAKLVETKIELEQKINLYENSDEVIAEMKKQLERQIVVLTQLSTKLNQSRTAVKPMFEKNIIEQLKQLGMPNAVFEIKFIPLEEFTNKGKDRIEFLFSANKNEPAKEISKVASGGEISRVMLCIKDLVSRNKELPCIIFDEIDTGVSGEIADKMGKIIKNMSQNMQVINITHLPQIASKGDQHLWVYKQDNEHSTQTLIKKLSSNERVIEIAKMLSGEGITDAAINNAKELLQIID